MERNAFQRDLDTIFVATARDINRRANSNVDMLLNNLVQEYSSSQLLTLIGVESDFIGKRR